MGDPIHSLGKRLRKQMGQEVGDNSGGGNLDRIQTKWPRGSKY